MAACPKCRAETLNVLQSAAELPGLGEAPLRCARCKGFWISLSAVSALRDSEVLEGLEQDVQPDENADKRAGLCPHGHGILSRTKASWRRPFYVERCRHCDGLWLDAGEWRRLSAEHLIEHLDELWAPAWRHKLRVEQSGQALQELLDARLGRELSERVEALALELAAHPQGDVGMAQLREIFRATRRKTRQK
jgi:Zn-finger nucleic acid-binding protein